MPPIVSAQGLSKKYGSAPLFTDISFTVSERERIGLIGPNGSGKSTLLAILHGSVTPDSGTVAIRKRATVSCVAQISEFAPGQTVRSIIDRALERLAIPEAERLSRLAETLGRAGFTDFDVPAAALSGGWRKRLAICEGLVQQADVLLLDEPTNHLDLGGIEWLEGVLQNAPFACVVVSHDRYFLENVATGVVELNPLYENGFLRVQGNYSQFLKAKEEYLYAQGKRQEALTNRVHNEIEWLRRGAKARTRKSKARIEKAQDMIQELAGLNARTRTPTAGIDFSQTNRQTKRLLELDQVAYAIGERTLFADVSFTIVSGMRVGLVGPNGSGKTTLLRLLKGEIQPSRGQVRQADALRITYFDQNRQLDPNVLLRRALAPDSDSVIYQDRVIHVAAWAARFLFSGEDLNQPVGRLSGGERARVLIAQLMLQPADVLLLDEPTNDLDIPTLEILEENLLEYRGALVLVSHDRYLLDRVSTVVLGLDGLGKVEAFADLAQWDAWRQSSSAKATPAGTPNRTPNGTRGETPKGTPDGKTSGPGASQASGSTAAASPPPARKKKLSYGEAREFATIEERIAAAEQDLHAKRSALEDPAVTSDVDRLRRLCEEMEESQKTIDDLYLRWAELEKKQA